MPEFTLPEIKFLLRAMNAMEDLTLRADLEIEKSFYVLKDKLKLLLKEKL